MNSIFILLIPYFGKLPSYFPAFVHSCSGMRGGKIMLLTDDESVSEYSFPEVFIVKKMSFLDMQKKVKERLGGILPSGYKLCDYRPAYGVLFDEYIKGFEYWGYCDCDTLMGDVLGFLEKINYQQYDRIGSKGHFTIYRNNDNIKKLYLHKMKKAKPIADFRYVSKTSYPCNFDERGMNDICREVGLSFYRENHVLAVEDHHSLHFHTYGTVYSSNVPPQLFVWEDGKVYLYEHEQGGSIKKTEYMYIHYEGRKNLEIFGPLGKNIYVCHLGFNNFEKNDVPSLLTDIGRADTAEEKEAYEKADKKAMRKSSRRKMAMEFRTCGLRAIPNITKRIVSVLNSRL